MSNVPTTKKFDFGQVVDNIHEAFKKDKHIANKIALGSALRVLNKEDFLLLPEWWQKSTGTYGLPYSKVVLIAGTSDSGKTSLAIEAMKAAQQQGTGIIYTETENKTTSKDLLNWGVDPEQLILVQARLAEEAFEMTCKAWEVFRAKYPDAPLLVVIDSLGNMISMRDSEIDMTKQDQTPGGKGKINRLGLNKLISMMETDSKVAVLLISYTYDNMGSAGKTNAGGQALNFFSSLTYQTSRKGWVEKTEKGQKIRIGADVVFKLYKNHLNKEAPGHKNITFRITNTGMQFLEGNDDE